MADSLKKFFGFVPNTPRQQEKWDARTDFATGRHRSQPMEDEVDGMVVEGVVHNSATGGYERMYDAGDGHREEDCTASTGYNTLENDDEHRPRRPAPYKKPSVFKMMKDSIIPKSKPKTSHMDSPESTSGSR